MEEGGGGEIALPHKSSSAFLFKRKSPQLAMMTRMLALIGVGVLLVILLLVATSQEPDHHPQQESSAKNKETFLEPSSTDEKSVFKSITCGDGYDFAECESGCRALAEYSQFKRPCCAGRVGLIHSPGVCTCCQKLCVAECGSFSDRNSNWQTKNSSDRTGGECVVVARNVDNLYLLGGSCLT